MFQEELRDYLINNLPMCKPASGGKFVVTKCPFCGDGKHTTSTHFYIGLGYNDNRPFGYCHLCHTYTGITPYFLNTYFDLYDMNINNNLYKINKKHYSRKDIDSLNIVKKINNFIEEDNRLNSLKLSYINKRLGTNLSYRDLIDLKIILNLDKFLRFNNIREYTRDRKIIESLSNYFIGFLSTDNAFINMRNLSKEGTLYKSIDRRYINYNIFKQSDNFLRYYTIPVDINKNLPYPVEIHISEGVFDILSVYFNLRCKKNHSIYTSCGGTGYMNVVKQVINGYGLFNVIWHIYRDNTGVEEYIFDNIIKFIRPYNHQVYIHSNRYPNEKDFGVPLDRIDEYIERVL